MKNKRIFLFISIVLMSFIGFIAISLVFKNDGGNSVSKKESTSEISISSKSKSSNSESGNKDLEEKKEQSDGSKVKKVDLDISKVMSAFVSQKLNVEDVEDREKYLKNNLTTTAFNDLQIELDSTNVKKMISDYQEKNQFNSSSKSILANKEVTTATVYRNITVPNSYYVEVKYNQTSPVMPDETLEMVEKMNMTTQDNKISNIVILSIETIQNDTGDSQ